MKKYNLIATIIAFPAILAGAQETGSKQQMNYLEISGYSGSRMAIQKRLDNRYQSINGTPYLFENWSTGKILLLHDTVGAEFPLRFNIYSDEMEFINLTDTLVISNPEKIRILWLEGIPFEYLIYSDGEYERMTYFQVLVPGKTRLLIRHACRLERGSTEVTPYSNGPTKDRFVSEKVYYYQSIDMDKAVLLPLTRKAIVALPPFSSPEVQDYMQSHKINLRKENDLLELFNWINQSSDKK